MSQNTPHTYRNRRGTFKINFDELEPENTITMRKATFEKLAGVKVDSGIPDRTAIKIGVPAEPKPVEQPEPAAPVVDHEANASAEEKVQEG